MCSRASGSGQESSASSQIHSSSGFDPGATAASAEAAARPKETRDCRPITRAGAPPSAPKSEPMSCDPTRSEPPLFTATMEAGRCV